jgi:hypothetical protein
MVLTISYITSTPHCSYSIYMTDRSNYWLKRNSTTGPPRHQTRDNKQTRHYKQLKPLSDVLKEWALVLT